MKTNTVATVSVTMLVFGALSMMAEGGIGLEMFGIGTVLLMIFTVREIEKDRKGVFNGS